MIKVHHLDNSRSHRILWLLEELEHPYEIVGYQRNATTRLAPPELKALHPLGKSPLISDGDTVIHETGAIVEYLLDRVGNGRLRPERGSPLWVKYLQWIHYAEGSAMLPMMLVLFSARLGEASAPLKPRVDSEVANHLSYMNQSLAATGYFVGSEFTACDVVLTFVLQAAEAAQRLAPYPHLVAHLARMRERPAYQRAVDKGGPISLAAFWTPPPAPADQPPR